MTVDETRKALKSLLDDMTALRSWIDVGSKESQPFIDALAAAKKLALEAAKEFVKAANTPAG